MFLRFIAACVSFAIIKSARILMVVPTPSISHQIVFRPLTEELINRGHEVTLITTNPVYSQGNSPNNLTEIDTHDVSYFLWNKMLREIPQRNLRNMLYIITNVYRVGSEVFEEQLKDKLVQQLLRDNTVKFDLLILEAGIMSPLIFHHIFKAPVIHMSSFGAKPGFMNDIGAMSHPVLYPTHYHQRIYNLTIWELISELYNHIALDYMIKNRELDEDKMLQRLFGTDTPPLNELKSNVHMLFLNIHPSWIHNQPVPSNVVYTWGIHKTSESVLSQDLQSYLDSCKNGFIYVSFGTNVKPSTIPLEVQETLLKVFSRLTCNILWKWDTEEVPGKPDNTKIYKWLPQRYVLKHPNLKLFITQGGLQSTHEAINAGVPLIGIPIYSDQEYNTEKYVYFKIGIQLNLITMTVENLENAIKTILTDESYRKNTIDLRTRMHDQPKSALENAVWWIEYVLRYGGARHLRAPAANMSWTEYYELELVLVILSGVTVLMTIFIVLVCSCCRCMLHVINRERNKIKVL